jgi:hypothetical protein
MKTIGLPLKTQRTSILAAAVLAIALGSTATFAADQGSKKPARPKAAATKVAKSKPAKPAEGVTVTGSHLRLPATKKARVTSAPLAVMDRQVIQTSGAGDLSQLLRKRITR